MGRAAIAVTALLLLAPGCSWKPTEIAPEIPANAQSSQILAADGTLIKTLHGPQNRVEVPLSAIPLVVQRAVIAIEDERFYQHNGVDLRGVLRAAKENAEQGDLAQGGSTITQQLVKNTLLSSGKTLDRKIQEASLAWELERHYSKERILEIYLNTVYFGNGAYGVEAAAETYFNRKVGDLDARQAATIAGLIQAPSDYDPLQHPDAALTRRNEVLDKMLEQHYVTQAEHDMMRAAPLLLEQPPPEGRYPAPHFVDEVIKFIETDPAFGDTPEKREELLYSGGLRIHTTVDLDLQAKAEDAVAHVLTDPDRDPDAALVAVDPETGYVRAMVGGRDYFGDQPAAKCNLAIGCKPTPGRGTGSAFKPFVLAEALNQHIPLSEVLPAPPCIHLDTPTGPWDPCNADPGEGAPGGADLVEGTVNSYNTLYAQLIMQVGPQNAVDMAARLGITTPLKALPSAVLGSNDVTVEDMASAYGTFANHGIRVPPVLVTEVTDANGTIIYQNKLGGTKAIDPYIADTVSSVLQQVIQRGTGTAAQLDRPAAGKTGTGEDYKNAWFCGYTPQLSTAVWVGYPTEEITMAPPRTPITVYGGTWPAQIWQRFMSAALTGTPPVDFRAPGPPPTTSTVPTEPPQSTDAEFPLGPDAEVPGVIGDGLSDATSKVQSAGFRWNWTTVDDDAPPGTVVRQSPPGGASAPTNSTVTLEVSSGSSGGVTVPDVMGLARSAAVQAIKEVGLVPDVHLAPAPSNGATGSGQVWLMAPTAGTVVDPGSTVTIIVAT
jgi:penicillin-binding protein 1A